MSSLRRSDADWITEGPEGLVIHQYRWLKHLYFSLMRILKYINMTVFAKVERLARNIGSLFQKYILYLTVYCEVNL